MEEIKFFVPGLPATAGSKKAFIHPKTRKIMVVDTCRKGASWRSDVKAFGTAAMNGRLPIPGPLEVFFEFYLPRPKGHFGKKGIKPSAPHYPATRPDVLKMARAVEDALTGICWTDDAQIVNERLLKLYDNFGKTGCWVRIWPA